MDDGCHCRQDSGLPSPFSRRSAQLHYCGIAVHTVHDRNHVFGADMTILVFTVCVHPLHAVGRGGFRIVTVSTLLADGLHVRYYRR